MCLYVCVCLTTPRKTTDRWSRQVMALNLATAAEDDEATTTDLGSKRPILTLLPLHPVITSFMGRREGKNEIGCLYSPFFAS